MREPTVARDGERGATGVIDTFSQGYAVVNRHPWVLALPILLDLFFWMGPRLSMASVVQGLLTGVPTPSGLTDEMLQSYSELQRSTVEALEGFNLFSLLATSFPGLPNIMAGRESAGATLQMDAALPIAWAAILLLLAGSWLGALYYSSVGQRVKGEDAGPAELVGTTWRVWLRLAGLLLLGMAAVIGIGAPLMAIVLLIATVAPGAVGLVGSFLWVTGIWVMFYLFFTVDAVIISGAGPFQAIRNSFAVVRHNLGSSLGLILLTWIIMLGLPIVWGTMAENPITAAMAIMGNAYVSTGLIAASMIFYRERFAALRAGVRGQGTGVRGS